MFGEYGGKESSRTEIFLEACKQAAIDAQITDSIERTIWEKFVFLVGLSGTTTSMRQPIGPIRQRADQSLSSGSHARGCDFRDIQGVDLSNGYAEDRLAFCDTLPPSMTSSMHHDLNAGRRLELPWLSGGVARMAQDLSIPAPRNQAVSDILGLYAEGKP